MTQPLSPDFNCLGSRFSFSFLGAILAVSFKSVFSNCFIPVFINSHNEIAVFHLYVGYGGCLGGLDGVVYD